MEPSAPEGKRKEVTVASPSLGRLTVPSFHPAPFRQLFFGPLLLTATIHTALVVLYASGFGGVSALVCADANKIGHWPYEVIHVGFPAGGFDGQFYYVLARDPWRRYEAPVIDLPAFRHARILYPSLAWVLTGGHPVSLLWVLPTINLVAIVGLAWLGARLAVHFDRSPWWGFLFPIALNTGMSALRNLTDPLATVMVCGLIAAWLLRWPTWQLPAWAAAAILCREQNVLIVMIVLIQALRARRRSSTVGLLAGLLVCLGWAIILKAIYGVWPHAAGNLGLPFAGMWYRWTHLEGLSGPVSKVVHVAGMLLLSCQVALSFALLRVSRNRMTVLIALSGGVLAILGGTGIYLSGWSYSRVLLWMPLGIWLWSVESGRRWPGFLLAATGLWPLAAVAQAWSA